MIPTNEDRAGWAYDAIVAYARKTRQDTSGDLKHDFESVYRDLLADMMHLADRDGIDFRRELDLARGHYIEELREEKHAKDEKARA